MDGDPCTTGCDSQRNESMIKKLDAQIDVDQQKDILPALPEEVAREKWNNSSSSLPSQHAVYSTQHALDVKQDSVIPYGTGTDESDVGGRVGATLRNLTGLQVRELGADTSLQKMTRIAPFCNVLNDSARGKYMGDQGQGEAGIMQKRYRKYPKTSQGNHDSSHGNPGHVFRHCRREFTSVKALGSHMTAHAREMGPSISWMKEPWEELGAVEMVELRDADKCDISDSEDEETEQESGSGEEDQEKGLGGDGRKEEEEATQVRSSSSEAALKELNNGCWAVSLCASKKDEEGGDEAEEKHEDKNAQQLQAHETLIYALRRNPKRSRRFFDQDYTASDMVPPPTPIPPPAPSPSCSWSKKIASSSFLQKKSTRACCTECGKEFCSWKALFGHMRCHPEREWRGIQPPPELCSSSRSVKGDVFARPRSHLRPQTAIRRKIKPSERATGIAQPDVTVCADFEDEEACKNGGGGGTWTGTVESQWLSNNVKIRTSLVRETSNNRKTMTDQEEEELDSSKDQVKLPLEEDNESETELSVEAAYVNNATNHHSSSAVTYHRHPRIRRKELPGRCHDQLTKNNESASCLLRGKRSRRSRLTVRSLQAVSESAAAELAAPSPSSIRLEELHAAATSREQVREQERDMADSLVLLALAGSAAAASTGKKAAQMEESTDESAFSGVDWAAERDGEEDDNGEELEWDGVTAAKVVAGAKYSCCETELGAATAKFECSSCKRRFKSHQALGGHRASHKKVKGCFARTTTSEGSPPHLAALKKQNPQIGCRNNKAGAATNRLQNGHQCSICLRGFSTGQALGGHKRCHWAGEKATSSACETFPDPSIFPLPSRGPLRRPKDHPLCLDLNLPAPQEEDDTPHGSLDDVVSINGAIAYKINLNMAGIDSTPVPPTLSTLLDSEDAPTMTNTSDFSLKALSFLPPSIDTFNGPISI